MGVFSPLSISFSPSNSGPLYSALRAPMPTIERQTSQNRPPPPWFRGNGSVCPFGVLSFFSLSQRREQKSLSIAKIHPKPSQEISEQLGPFLHETKGFCRNTSPKTWEDKFLGIPFLASIRDGETTITIKCVSFEGGALGGREESRPRTLFFLGKRHDNNILKVQLQLSRNLCRFWCPLFFPSLILLLGTEKYLPPPPREQEKKIFRGRLWLHPPLR